MMPAKQNLHPIIEDFRARGALFVVNHSGGKDSQAMFHVIRALVPKEQILVIHAHLPGVEWEGTAEHVRKTIGDHAYIETRAGKTFMEMVRHRGRFPSPQQRQCTSDLKRGPIEREIRRYLKVHPEFRGRVVNAVGLRAEESPNRARAQALKYNARNSKAGREWYDWLPIHQLTTDEVLAVIRENAQEPHWAYFHGMSRLSCCFCIMASYHDLRTAAALNPEMYRQYVELEQALNQTMLMPVKGERRFLENVTGMAVEDAFEAYRRRVA